MKKLELREVLIKKFRIFTLHNYEEVQQFKKNYQNNPESNSSEEGIGKFLIPLIFLGVLLYDIINKKEKPIDEERIQQIQETGILIVIKNSIKNFQIFPITEWKDFTFKVFLFCTLGSLLRWGLSVVFLTVFKKKKKDNEK